MPTDGLAQFYDAMLEMKAFGFDNAKSAQIELGTKLRQIVEGYGYKSLAAKAFKSPTVIVSHTDRDDIKNGAAFAALGVQIAAGVPLEVVNPMHSKHSESDCLGLINLPILIKLLQISKMFFIR